jgi:putative hydrolase of the HAD superfamily
MPLALFDLDNTLIDRAGAFRDWVRAFVANRALGGQQEIAWLEGADNDGFAPRGEFFREVRRRYELAESVDDLVTAFQLEFARFVQPPVEETRAALQALRARGWKLAIVTNGSPSQQAKIEAAGLAAMVDGWAISEVVGSRKPEPAIFQVAADACSCALKGGWMVGDSARADIGGAVACGLRSIWISRGRAWSGAHYEPDAVVETVAEGVAHILGQRQPSRS